MHKITLLMLACFSTQIYGAFNPLRELEDDITSIVGWLQANSSSSQFTIDLENIRTNVIVNRVFYDGINVRELRNVYVCWRFAFEEVLSHLNLRASPPELGTFEEPPARVKPAPKKPEAKAFFEIVEKIHESAERLASIDVGELVRVVDTLAHFVQTRFQHDQRFAEQYATTSTTLIKSIISRQELGVDPKESVAVLLAQLREIARLSGAELEAYPEETHVELFFGGLSNVLNVLESAQSGTNSLPFWRRALLHSLDSVFEGRAHVKQALALRALYYKKRALELGHNVTYACLRSLSSYERATTADIKREFRVQALLSTHLPLIQTLAVQTHNTFRLSHEENLQGLFLHLAYALVQMKAEDKIDALQHLVIDSYRSGGDIDSTTAYFRKLLITLQRKLLNNLLQIN